MQKYEKLEKIGEGNFEMRRSLLILKFVQKKKN